MIRELALVTPAGVDDLQVIDSTPVPCGMSRETAHRSDLAGEAGYSYASHSRFVWGMRLYLPACAAGRPLMWCPANPRLGKREVMTAMLEVDHHLAAERQVIPADKSFTGGEFEQLCAAPGVHVVRPRRGAAAPTSPPPRPNADRCARGNESIPSSTPSRAGCLWNSGARTHGRVFARIGQRLPAMATVIWHNTKTGAPRKRSLIAHDH